MEKQKATSTTRVRNFTADGLQQDGRYKTWRMLPLLRRKLLRFRLRNVLKIVQSPQAVPRKKPVWAESSSGVAPSHIMPLKLHMLSSYYRNKARTEGAARHNSFFVPTLWNVTKQFAFNFVKAWKNKAYEIKCLNNNIKSSNPVRVQVSNETMSHKNLSAKAEQEGNK